MGGKKTLCTNLAVRVKTRVNDAVHVQVQVVELHAVGIRFRRVDWKRNAVVADGGVFLDDIGDGERVPVGEPPVKRWHSHSKLKSSAPMVRKRQKKKKRERRKIWICVVLEFGMHGKVLVDKQGCSVHPITDTNE